MTLWSKGSDSSQAKYRAKKRKLPQDRAMLCTDIQIDEGLPEKAFIKAWNLLVSHRMKHIASFKNLAATTDNLLLKYRADEFVRLLETVGTIKKFDYDFSLKLLDHIEVFNDGRMIVVFLTETRVTI